MSALSRTIDDTHPAAVRPVRSSCLFPDGARLMTTLLDSNVLIALTVEDHVQHAASHQWLESHDGVVAACPITQGALLRILLRSGQPMDQSLRLLSNTVADPRLEFWADDLSYVDVAMTGVVGHRQVTDAYLASLARHHGGRLATFDKGLAALHADVAELVPVG